MQLAQQPSGNLCVIVEACLLFGLDYTDALHVVLMLKLRTPAPECQHPCFNAHSLCPSVSSQPRSFGPARATKQSNDKPSTALHWNRLMTVPTPRSWHSGHRPHTVRTQIDQWRDWTPRTTQEISAINIGTITSSSQDDVVKLSHKLRELKYSSRSLENSQAHRGNVHLTRVDLQNPGPGLLGRVREFNLTVEAACGAALIRTHAAPATQASRLTRAKQCRIQNIHPIRCCHNLCKAELS